MAPPLTPSAGRIVKFHSTRDTAPRPIRSGGFGQHAPDSGMWCCARFQTAVLRCIWEEHQAQGIVQSRCVVPTVEIGCQTVRCQELAPLGTGQPCSPRSLWECKSQTTAAILQLGSCLPFYLTILTSPRQGQGAHGVGVAGVRRVTKV